MPMSRTFSIQPNPKDLSVCCIGPPLGSHGVAAYLVCPRLIHHEVVTFRFSVQYGRDGKLRIPVRAIVAFNGEHVRSGAVIKAQRQVFSDSLAAREAKFERTAPPLLVGAARNVNCQVFFPQAPRDAHRNAIDTNQRGLSVYCGRRSCVTMRATGRKPEHCDCGDGG